MSFIPLWVKTGYSFFRSILTAHSIIEYAEKNGLSSVGIADTNALFAVAELTFLSKKSNIQPILGMEIHVLEEDDSQSTLLLYACNWAGYQSLMRLTEWVSKGDLSIAIPRSILSSYAHGILAVFPCGRSKMFNQSNDKEAYLLSFSRIFSNFYLGLEPHYSDNFSYYRSVATAVSVECIPIVETRLLVSDQSPTLAVLEAIQKGCTVEEVIQDEPLYSFSDYETLSSLYLNEEIQRTFDIAALCKVDAFSHQTNLIDYPMKTDVNRLDYFSALCWRGLEKRLNSNEIPSVYKNRLSYEIDVIKSMNYTNYFLVVWDYVKFAKQAGILVGPGRGSAAGSLVSYVLGITNVDPIPYKLLFERFLNPERISMPDIDIDFPDDRRDEVVHYLLQRYGLRYAAHVIAFQTFGARQALRDAGKALGLSNVEVDVIAKKIPAHYRTSSLRQVYDEVAPFRSLIDGRSHYRQVFSIAESLEGLPRQTTLHAAGVVISSAPLSDIIPVYSSSDDTIATQFDMNYLESLGLLKMDLLGLRNLTIINQCYDLIDAQMNTIQDRYQLDLNHPSIYSLISSGKTAGIFQLESAGMKRAIRLVQPNCFEDIVAILALFRPGPMEFIQDYALRKQGKTKVSYPHPSLEPILSSTYGIIIYQEQIIQILQSMAGFSLGKSDLVRRAISKKESETLQTIRHDFVEGSIHNGFTEQTATEVFDLIARFADYGFNRSHSVAYAMIACQMAYLKARYPSIFYASVLNSVAGAADQKMHEYFNELREMRIRLLPISIQHSSNQFMVEGIDSIRYSFQHIKSLPNQAIQCILLEREKAPFNDFLDAVLRLIPRGVSLKSLQTLIVVGAFDEFSINRETLLASAEDFCEYARLIANEIDGQIVLDPSLSSPPHYHQKPMNKLWRLEQELEYLGFYMSGFPLEDDRPFLIQQGVKTIADAYQQTQGSLTVVGMITNLRTLKTKRGEAMAMFQLRDETDSIQVVVFPQTYNQTMRYLNNSHFVTIRGVLQIREQTALLADDISMYQKQEG
ncbi:MAG: DNA polymerase III subunit alpha [Bacilli bacterium]